MLTGTTGEPWLYAAAGADVVVHLAAFAWMLRRTDASDARPSADPANATGDVTASPPSDVDPVESDEAVVCPHCSVENDPDYRFCRYCSGELGGGAGPGNGSLF